MQQQMKNEYKRKMRKEKKNAMEPFESRVMSEVCAGVRTE